MIVKTTITLAILTPLVLLAVFLNGGDDESVGSATTLSERQIKTILDARLQNGQRPVQVLEGARIPDDEKARGYKDITEIYGQVFPNDVAIDARQYPDDSWGYTIRKIGGEVKSTSTATST